MPERAPLLIHIGYHKTGTTWLQSGLFANASAGFTRPWSSQPIREQLVLPTVFEFDAARARCRFAAERTAAAARGLVAVISDERLSGSPHAGGYDSSLVAERLARAFPDGRVLIVVREQRDAIYSIYQQYVRDGGAASLRRYLAPRNPAEVPQFRFSHWEYHWLVSHYFALFGRERVMVLPFEQLRADVHGFVAAVAAHVGLRPPATLPAGERYPAWSALCGELKRRANFWLVRNALNPAAPLYVKNHEVRFDRLDRLLPRVLSRGLERRQRRYIAQIAGSRYAARRAASPGRW